MKASKITRTIVALVMMLIGSLAVSAQTSGDKLYNQGLQFQKTLTIRSQRNAIAKFTSAKKLYDSQTKKAQCDQAIAVSRNIIAQISNGGGNLDPGHRNESAKEEKEQALNISPNDFAIDCHPKTLTVTVAAINIEDWTALPVSNADGSSFLTVKKGDGVVTIECDRNDNTAAREQTVVISGGEKRCEVKVTQAGVPVQFTASKPMLEFGRNGGKKNIDLFTNSTTNYEENNNLTWKIVSKPEWVNVVVETGQPKKKLGGILGKAKKLSENILHGDSGENNQGPTNTIVVNADKIAKGTYEFNNGRKGELVLASDDQTIAILIVQK